MKYHELPNGDSIPALGLGTWKSAGGEAYAAVKEAIRIGYRHIDCAPTYFNEREIGEALKEALVEGEVNRSDLWITSKLPSHSHGEAEVLPALEKTLSDLQLDYLDLFLIHWPVALSKGVVVPERGEDFRSLEVVPLSTTWKAMEACRKQGLCRHIGVSNFSVKKLTALIAESSTVPAMNQVESHPFLQQHELMDYCRRENILVTAYSPLGSRDRPAMLIQEDEPNLLDHPLIHQIAEKQGITAAQTLIGWALNRGTIVIPKSTDPGRLRENFAAAEIELPPQDMTAIAALDRHYRYVDAHFWEMEGSSYTVATVWDE